MSFERITESNSNYDDLELKSSLELLKIINNEDQSVAFSVKKELNTINKLILKVIEQIKKGGRLFYIGSGTSGRLGVVDASECPPTFGVDSTLVNGIIAGGDNAIRKSIENAEDEPMKGWEDLLEHNINKNDFVIGIAASGTTPYVIGAVSNCFKNNIPSGCITCNTGSPLYLACEYPIGINVGPEVVTGSSRMKAGTAQKMVLNMISTISMIKIGKIKGNKMVDMQLSNDKLVNRGKNIIMNTLGVNEKKANELLNVHKSVRKAINSHSK